MPSILHGRKILQVNLQMQESPDAVVFAPKHAQLPHRQDFESCRIANVMHCRIDVSVCICFVFIFIIFVFSRFSFVHSADMCMCTANIAERKKQIMSLFWHNVRFNANATSNASLRVGYKRTSAAECSQLFWNVRIVKAKFRSIWIFINRILHFLQKKIANSNWKIALHWDTINKCLIVVFKQ